MRRQMRERARVDVHTPPDKLFPTVAELVDANTGEWKKSQPSESAIGDHANWIDRAGSSPAGGN